MASQPLETIPEEPAPAPTPTPTPARVTADPPQTKPAKNSGRVVRDLLNATAWQGRPRKRNKQLVRATQPLQPRQPQLVLMTQTQTQIVAAASQSGPCLALAGLLFPC